MIANTSRKKGSKAITVEDCMPKWDQPEASDERTPEEQRAAFAALVGKTAKRKLLGPNGNPITT